MDAAAEWDERYSSADRLWTADVNPALVAEAGDLPAGSALDVGSGEGADARWLADRGWHVMAVDISQVALDRAADIANRPDIDWVQVDLAIDGPPGGTYDLVSACYFPITRADRAIVDRLIGAVAPGGHLLIVAHAPEGIRAHGFDPDEYFSPADVAGLLDPATWSIRLDTRERGVAAGGGHHTHDVVLHAQRTDQTP